MLSELEKLLTIPKLTKINIVSDSIGSIKLFGENIRKLSQERLITSILEKNQASIASCLQVFYNLESLPEVILLVIDTIVRQTVELSSNLLDFEVLNSYQSELFMSPLATNTTTMNTSTNTTISNNLSNTNTPMKSTNTLLSKHNSNKAPLTLVQLRILIREIAHNWSTILSEKAIQIHVFQRILSKKEDPTTHEKFLDVLYKRGNEKNHQTISSTNSISTTKLSNLPRELINGRLLELFWYRLGVALVDISIDKMKLYPYAASRAYPYLRKATVEVVDNLLSITRTEYGSNGKNDRLIAMLSSNNFHIDEEKYYENSNNLDYDTHENQQSSMFGSLEWTQLELIQSSLPYNNRTNKSYNNHNYNHNLNNNKIIDVSNGSDTNNIDNNEEIPLLLGLKPMRDTYLINVLGRMTGPVMQMFPEIEGYTGICSLLQYYSLIITNHTIIISCKLIN